MPASTPTAYATAADLTKYGIGASALGDVEADMLQGALDAANAVADSYLRSKFTLPLSSWDIALTLNVCKLAAAQFMRMRGFSPEGIDQSIRDGELDALKWFQGIARGDITPVAQDASGAASTYGGPFVVQPQLSSSDPSVLVAGPSSARGF